MNRFLPTFLLCFATIFSSLAYAQNLSNQSVAASLKQGQLRQLDGFVLNHKGTVIGKDLITEDSNDKFTFTKILKKDQPKVCYVDDCNQPNSILFKQAVPLTLNGSKVSASAEPKKDDPPAPKCKQTCKTHRSCHGSKNPADCTLDTIECTSTCG